MSGLFGPRIRLTLERIVRTSGSGVGDPVATWGPLQRTSPASTRVWAQLMRHAGRDEHAADQVLQVTTRTWRLVRLEAGLTTRDRVVDEAGQVWYLHDVRPVPARKGARRCVTQITAGTERLA